MREWFIYQPDGNYIGPIGTTELARGIVAGKVPRDAHVASPGDSEWFPVLTVSEIGDEVRRLELSPEPVQLPIPSVPPAPPPRPEDSGHVIDFDRIAGQKLVVSMAGMGFDPKITEQAAPPASEPKPAEKKPEEKKEEKKEEKPAFKPDPRLNVVPYAIFGACAVIAALILAVGFVMRPAAPAPPTAQGTH